MSSYIKKKSTPKKVLKRKKPCYFHLEEMKHIDYKNVGLISKFINTQGKILPSRVTGTCAKHQRQLATVIKRARIVALIPFTIERERL